MLCMNYLDRKVMLTHKVQIYFAFKLIDSLLGIRNSLVKHQDQILMNIVDACIRNSH